jgi:hypothetical protein
MLENQIKHIITSLKENRLKLESDETLPNKHQMKHCLELGFS